MPARQCTQCVYTCSKGGDPSVADTCPFDIMSVAPASDAHGGLIDISDDEIGGKEDLKL